MRIGAVGSVSPDNRIYIPETDDMRLRTGQDPESSAAGTLAVSSASGSDEPGEPEKVLLNPGESMEVAPGRKSSPAECKTCAERKYQDGSDEMVSFKSAAHISPEASAARVRAHEQEHVSNAYKKAARMNGKVIQASVSLSTAICPECGRSYVDGGLTRTQISYTEESPYSREKKALDAQALSGANFKAEV